MERKKRILSVFGTRPEAIKMAPLVRALHEHPRIESAVCVTAQHREMLDQVLRLFEITPQYDLDLMRERQTLSTLTSRVLTQLTDVFSEFKPDVVVVHGDTTTTMAASLAAFYLKVPVAHIEAGLRTWDINSPWPEEFNRRVAGLVTDYHFAPTESAAKNLLAEGVAPSKVWVTGNTVIDALFLAIKKIEENPQILEQLERQFAFLHQDKKVVLVTCHRRENWGEPLSRIFSAIKKIAERPDVQIVYPVHLNPIVKEMAVDMLSGCQNIHLIDPLDYLPFVYLMKRAYLIVTDSGGVQEEAPSIGKPVIVVRETTERPEAVSAGTVKVVGTDTEDVFSAVSLLLEHRDEYNRMAAAQNPFGDGFASQKITEVLEK